MAVVESAKILSVPTKGQGDTKDDRKGDILYPHRAQHSSNTLEHTESGDAEVKELADEQSGTLRDGMTC